MGEQAGAGSKKTKASSFYIDGKRSGPGEDPGQDPGKDRSGEHFYQ